MADQESNKTIKDYRDDYYYFTGEASKINRNLALAGIAVIWFFRETNGGINSIPDSLANPLFCLVIALALDLLHYVVGGFIWFIFYKRMELKFKKNKNKQNINIEAPKVLPVILHWFYWAKICANIVAYYYILIFLYFELISKI